MSLVLFKIDMTKDMRFCISLSYERLLFYRRDAESYRVLLHSIHLQQGLMASDDQWC